MQYKVWYQMTQHGVPSQRLCSTARKIRGCSKRLDQGMQYGKEYGEEYGKEYGKKRVRGCSTENKPSGCSTALHPGNAVRLSRIRTHM